jgi:predicted Fe-Mo cluster-binding NifX family protein
VNEGGLNGIRSGHFGHCDVFTLIDVKNGEIAGVSTVQNQEHTQGGCMVPVRLLAENNVNAIIVGGIGLRPLAGFKQAGIEVYYQGEEKKIAPVVDECIAGTLNPITENQTCGGGGHH